MRLRGIGKMKGLLVMPALGQANFVTTNNCYGQLTNMTSSSAIADTNVTSWDWDLNNDSLFNEASGKSIDNLFSAMDTFWIGLRITHTGGVDSIFKQVIVRGTPFVNFTLINLCFGDTAIFSDE